MGSICSSYISNKNAISKNYQPYSEKSKFLQLSHFSYISTLGEGSFGKVILARRKTTQVLQAIKFIQTDRLRDLAKREFAKLERQVLIEIQNEFIVKLHHIFESFGRLCFVLDFMQGGSLDFHLHKHGQFKSSDAAFFAAEVLIGLEVLHKREFIYRDLKPGNILLDITGHIKLADFNLCTTTEDLSDQICGTPEYAAPEVVSGNIQGPEVDFWSFGVLIYHLIQGSTPFASSNNHETCKNILMGKYKFTSKFDRSAVDLVSKLLVVNPKHRLSIHRAIKDHKFFSEVDWELVEKREMCSPLRIEVKDPCDLRYFPDKKYPEVCMESKNEDIEVSVSGEFSEFSYNSEVC